MHITEQASNGVVVLHPVGRIDSGSTGEFESVLMSAIGGDGTRIVVDMAQLSYISSAGLRSLLVAAKAARAKRGSIVLSAMAPHIREMFDVSGFSSLFQIHADAAAAVAALEG
ncbi:anti-anti-sigma factor [Azospirillum sp. TSH100]|uniref:STAS domain-containing protein n=1 Tax=Azospirillum sp. TSH100 TaxID=652764 RepID=UPI000D60F58F|nr:STAS domain-containing protein [Azospirillum sp. TSH100]PWC83844.1 anti-anti-sigma factor [Azospirillum sp. TSH100]QCG88381.1 STAS domain-containing protein [Azospirillum sp. TSH100]